MSEKNTILDVHMLRKWRGFCEQGDPLTASNSLAMINEIERLWRSVECWQSDAKRYAMNADFWEQRAKRAETELGLR